MSLNALPEGPLGFRMDQLSTSDQIAAAGAIGSVTFGIWKAISAAIKRSNESKEQKEARLRSWEDSLQRREKEYREEIEERLEQVIKRTLEQDGLIAALRVENDDQKKLLFVAGRTLVAVTVELQEINPESITAARALRFVSKHFNKPAFELPEEWVELLHKFDRPPEAKD